MKYLIIGNSIAAVGCIEAIRSRDTQGEITVVSDEKHHVYGRPTISYYLMGAIAAENMKYRPDDFYEKNKVSLILGVKATAIDAKKKNVTLSDGQKLDYDRLLVATGSRPFLPPAQGFDKVEKCFTFMTYDDMLALEGELSGDKKVVVIGAGLIGLKCVEGILERVKEVTVVDLADRVLPSVMDAECAAYVQRHLEKKGVKFILGDCAESFTKNSVTLKNSKKTLDFDILVMAVGVRANTSLVADAGGAVGRGITVDTHMRTSLPDVYAAGDCAEGLDSSIGANRVLALLPNAYAQGKTAGLNMAGGDEEYLNAIPLNAVGFFGMHILSAGVYEGECYTVKDDEKIKKLFVKDGRLCGFILIDDFLRAGIYTSLVREKTPLAGVDFEILKHAPQLLAFGREARKAKLSKRV